MQNVAEIAEVQEIKEEILPLSISDLAHVGGGSGAVILE